MLIISRNKETLQNILTYLWYLILFISSYFSLTAKESSQGHVKKRNLCRFHYEKGICQSCSVMRVGYKPDEKYSLNYPLSHCTMKISITTRFFNLKNVPTTTAYLPIIRIFHLSLFAFSLFLGVFLVADTIGKYIKGIWTQNVKELYQRTISYPLQ